ncbi:MAG: RNA polymerase sporulation sigma factor SigK [Clostridia bacterium]|nr:RNA polymerase sporulation sigma factor SigK [Clostridia bacterium]
MLEFLFFLIRDALLLLGHLSGGGSFPKPLSREEEAACLKKMRDGNEDARNQLIEHNLRLVAHVVRKYTVPGYTQEDLVSVGTLGLIKAIQTYKLDAPTPLSTYAARCIENEVLMLLRSSRKYKGDVSLSEPIGMDGEGNDISFQDVLGSPADLVEDEAIRRLNMAQVRKILQTLPGRERMVLEMRYGLLGEKALMQHEVAEKLGISRSYVSRIESRAIRLIRDRMTGGES